MSDATGNVFGTFPSDPYQVFNQTKTLLGFQMTNVDLQIVNRTLFMVLVEELLLNPIASFTLSGVASATVTTRIGELVLDNVSLSQNITLNGIFYFYLYFCFYFFI
jgi:hypothetical protein